jgi:hypothetical protein
MPRRRKYASPAERQAAYMARKLDKARAEGGNRKELIERIAQLMAQGARLETEMARLSPPRLPPRRPPAAKLEDLMEQMATALRDLPKEQRMRAVTALMRAVDLNIRDWVSTIKPLSR